MHSPARQWLLWLAVIFGVVLVSRAQNTNEAEATQFLRDLDPRYIIEANAQMMTRWKYITNVTDENSNAQIEADGKFFAFQKEAWLNVTKFNWNAFNDATVKREFQYLNILGPAALEDADIQRYNELRAEMETIYSTAKICPFNQQGPDCKATLPLDPDLTEIMATSTNYSELEYVWVQWRNVAGRTVRKQYLEFVDLNNKAAKANGYGDMGSLWNEYYLYEGYSESAFKMAIEELWQTVKPLYIELYTYVRRILATNVYPGDVQRYGRLPANVLGNMWAQSWGNIGKHVLPFPKATAVDSTPEMIKQNYTAQDLFDKAEEFFKGLGFDPMTSTFKKESMITRPNDREVVCHASAEEFFFGPGTNTDVRDDWRIKMCTEINQDDFVTVHHEMGHIQYFMCYRNQHWVFRNGANPGFHEAIGDTIALSVSTPAHLLKLGLLPPTSSEPTEPLVPDQPERPPNVSEQDLNYLLSQALEKIAFIPFGYLMDKWRWSVFSGNTTDKDLNEYWWALREELQGLRPPVSRSEDDFDAGAKYHIPANVEYIRYFVSYIVQFQFYEALCKEAGQYDPNDDNKPLYKCDFDNSKAAGDKLKAMLEPGFSKPWPQSLNLLTGSDKMDASSLMNYFQPLYNWLKDANKVAKDCSGWEGNCEDFAKAYMEGEYETNSSLLLNQATIAEWNYETNLTELNGNLSTIANIEYGKYQKYAYDNYLTQFEFELFENETLSRQFALLQTLGTAAMPEEDQTSLSNVINKMSDQYSSAKICPYKKSNCKDEEKLYLEPDIVDKIATSTDYDELTYLWSEWRKVASKPMRDDYKEYVRLENKAAEANGLHDMGELWVQPYETENFHDQLEAILNQTRSLYENLHAFTRMKLRERYGENRIAKGTKDNPAPPIPSSILGNMWAQTWESLYDIMAPYPNASAVDVTDEMIKQEWDVLKMFTTAEEFYTSLGLEPMPTTYGNKSMITKPEDGREVVCHASAWDFSDKEDFRIKMCTVVNMVDLVTIHHEQGHIQYYEQYKDQAVTFRDGANPGFHEAIGDTMALSASTPKHLFKIGLIEGFNSSDIESDYNFLMRTALEKVTFLPFAYVMDRWRWGVFSGEYQPEKWTWSWYMLSEKYQGISPPVLRHTNDFDPGAKYHIAADVEYSRYFVANVLQFQFHKALCEAAGEYEYGNPEKPLYRCDIYKSTEAGDIMKKLLQAGSSRPWPDILEEATGSRDLNAAAIIEYFEPINKYIEEELKKANEPVGWRSNFEQFIEGYQNIDNTVPIIVGAVLGAMVLIVIVAYFVGRSRNRRKHNHAAVVVDPEVGASNGEVSKDTKGAHDNAAYDRLADEENDNPPPPANPYVRQLPPTQDAPVEEENKSSTHDSSTESEKPLHDDTPAEEVAIVKELEKPTATEAQVSAEPEKPSVHEETKKEDHVEVGGSKAEEKQTNEAVKEEKEAAPPAITSDEKEPASPIEESKEAEKPTEDKPSAE